MREKNKEQPLIILEEDKKKSKIDKTKQLLQELQQDKRAQPSLVQSSPRMPVHSRITKSSSVTSSQERTNQCTWQKM